MIHRLVKKSPALMSLVLKAFLLSAALSSSYCAAPPGLSNSLNTAALDSKSKQAAKESEIESIFDSQKDASFIDALEHSPWESGPLLLVSARDTKFFAEDGNAVEEAGGKPVAILLEYGCQNVISRSFKRGQRVCNLHLFRFASDAGAFGAYTSMREGSSNVVMRGQSSSEDQDSISFYTGNYFVLLKTNADGDDEAKELLTSLANKLSKSLPQGAPVPQLFLKLPHYCKRQGSEKYFLGEKAALRYCNLPFLESLALDKSQGVAYAEYQYARPMAERLKLLIVHYKSKAEADSAFRAYKTELESFSHKTTERSMNEVLHKLKDSYSVLKQNNDYLYLIAGSRKPLSPNLLLRELSRGD